jgi:hypothetical protein
MRFLRPARIDVNHLYIAMPKPLGSGGNSQAYGKMIGRYPGKGFLALGVCILSHSRFAVGDV